MSGDMIIGMEWWQLGIYAVMATGMSVFSGIAGGGGGFVMTPLLIFLGLSPAQAVSTGKIGGLAVTIGSLGGMRAEHGRLSRRRVVPVMILALVVGLLVPFVIRSLESEAYRVLLGIILLLMIPVLIVKKVGIEPHQPKLWQRYAGGALLTLALFLQGVFSGGLGTLVNVVLMGMLGMTATEANMTKRWSQLILNITVVLGVLLSHLIVWPIVAVGVPANLVGGYLGGKLAIKRGNRFVMNVMIILMVTSALALIFGMQG
ncbi:MAG: rane protein of unknown function [Patescibacteria group bacterium]|nr:rane protein of unknown function [Patescibacteria group bacterium]